MENTKSAMLMKFKQGLSSDDVEVNSPMYFAMYAYELYGSEVQDNTFEQLVKIGEDELEQDKDLGCNE